MTARYFSEAPREMPDLETLIDVIMFELSNHFKISSKSVFNWLVRWLGHIPAERFGKLMQQFDQHISESSIWEAARQTLNSFSAGWSINAMGEIPQSGPLLVVANHPGMADAVAAMAVVKRADLSFLAIERPILRAMPHASQHIIYVEEENPLRFGLIQKIIDKLKAGETVIMFPRGNLEPDPGLMSGAVDSLGKWSQSVGLFLSKVPETFLQPLLISNAFAPKAWHSQIARLMKNNQTRQQVSMVLQIVMQRLFPQKDWKTRIHLTVPEALAVKEISSKYDPHELNSGVIAYMKALVLREYPDQLSANKDIIPATQ